jgi:hypothetical protein
VVGWPGGTAVAGAGGTHRPVLHLPEIPAAAAAGAPTGRFLFRYDDVRAVLQDPSLSSDHVNPDRGDLVQQVFVECTERAGFVRNVSGSLSQLAHNGVR